MTPGWILTAPREYVKEFIGIGAALFVGDDLKLDSRSDVRIAGKVRAGGDLTLDGAINVERLVVC